MIRITAEEALAAYEAVRPRLPAAATSEKTPRRAATIADMRDEFDVFLLDAFGVLNIGETAIPGTAERIRELRAAGKRLLVVSNAASVPVRVLGAKYRRLGYDFAEHEIVTSRETLGAHLNGTRALHWGIMAGDGDRLEDFGALTTTTLEDDPRAYAEVDGFLLVGSGDWTDSRQARLEGALAQRPRPVLVANPDIVAPREDGFSAEPGFYAHRLADETGVAPAFFGKPFPDIFDLALARLGADTDRGRVLMVGDSLHTDILGAHAAGVASALVTGFGFLAGRNACEAIRKTGITPDFVLDRP